MAHAILLDTSVYSQPIRRIMHPEVAARWNRLDPETAAVSAICEAEILYGLSKEGSPRMRQAYDATLRNRFTMLPFDGNVAATYGDLRTECERGGITVAPMDLLIAATAKTHNLTVATLNVRDFARIPGLIVEDWSQQPATPTS